MVDLDTAKQNMRVEHDEEDALILRLIDVAARYVTRITTIPHDENAPEDYDHCVLLLVGSLYKNREAVSDRQQVKVPYGFEMLLQSLRPGESLI